MNRQTPEKGSLFESIPYIEDPQRDVPAQARNFAYESIPYIEDPQPVASRWYAEWFNDPAYHALYKHRDDAEAQFAIDNLMRALDLPPGSKVLDLACGKGRHARYLAQKGFDVTGLDIAAESIRSAQAFEHDRLHFYRHDMRRPFRINYYDAILNFFTSFGYFDSDADHLRTLQHVRTGLRVGGYFLIDYFNAAYVRRCLKPRETRDEDGYHFTINRYYDATHVYKRIEVRYPDGRERSYTERVRLYDLSDFEDLFAASGLRPLRVYGDYSLDAFAPDDAPRLILIAQKRQV